MNKKLKEKKLYDKCLCGGDLKDELVPVNPPTYKGTGHTVCQSCGLVYSTLFIQGKIREANE